LRPDKFEFKPDANRTIKHFVYAEVGTQISYKNDPILANSAMLPELIVSSKLAQFYLNFR
jgi:hypothetical protein